MKTTRRLNLLAAALVCALATTMRHAQAQEAVAPNAEQIYSDMKMRRAVEAAMWAMPMMSFQAMRDGCARDNGAGPNAITYFSAPADWHWQISTPNNSSLYVMSFWNTKAEPIVVEIPKTSAEAALFGTLMDAWQRPVIDVGDVGLDRGQGGKYLLLPPDYQGPFPAGYHAYKQKTFNGWFLLRVILKDLSPAMCEKGVALVKQMKVYPLSQAGKSEQKFSDAYKKDIDGIPHIDARYFAALNGMIQEEPAETRDMVMFGMLKTLGIEKGAEYKPTPKDNALFDKATKVAQQTMLALWVDPSTGAYWKGKHWKDVIPPEIPLTELSWDLPNRLEITERAAVYFGLCTSSKLYGVGTKYFVGGFDADGDRLQGDKNYKLTVPKDVPVSQFWSVLSFDDETAGWIKNMPKPGVSSLDTGIKTNADGTIDLFLGPKAPQGMEANWIPTQPGKGYFLLYRFYGPKKELLNRSWVATDPVKIK